MENKKIYIKRLERNKKFIYTDQNNNPINDKKILDKISKSASVVNQSAE